MLSGIEEVLKELRENSKLKKTLAVRNYATQAYPKDTVSSDEENSISSKAGSQIQKVDEHDHDFILVDPVHQDDFSDFILIGPAIKKEPKFDEFDKWGLILEKTPRQLQI